MASTGKQNANNKYFYRSERRGGRVVRRYVGSRSNPALAALLGAERLRRAEARAARETTRQEQRDYAVAEDLLLRFQRRVDAVLRLAAAADRQKASKGRATTPIQRGAVMVDSTLAGDPAGPDREEFDALVERVEAGDAAAVKDLRKLLRAYPVIWDRLTDLPCQAEEAMLNLVAGTSPLLKASMRCRLDALREELGAQVASPLDRLVMERVVLTWLDVNITHIAHLLPRDRKAEEKHWQQRHGRAQRRHLRAIELAAKLGKAVPSGE
jgi:hypothetical protein